MAAINIFLLELVYLKCQDQWLAQGNNKSHHFSWGREGQLLD
jgi:hypothetical protein